MKCKDCGAVIPENSKFCLECGAKVEVKKETKAYRPGLMHYAYGNNQTCGGKSKILIRNGFVYRIINRVNEAAISVTPVSDNDTSQTLYLLKGQGAFLSCINMVEDELIFAERGEQNSICAFNVYTGEKRVIKAGVEPEAIWIENEIITYVEADKLYSLKIDGEDFYSYNLDYKVADRLIGYSGKIYTCTADTSEAMEIPYYSSEIRPLGFEIGKDMLYAMIGNLYYAPVNDDNGNVIMCKEISSLNITNGIQDTDRLITAFEQYVLFNRKDDAESSFLWNIQTLRVYKLNRHIDVDPYSFCQALSDYIFLEKSGKLYMIPSPEFFQGEEDVFIDKYLF